MAAECLRDRSPVRSIDRATLGCGERCAGPSWPHGARRRTGCGRSAI